MTERSVNLISKMCLEPGEDGYYHPLPGSRIEIEGKGVRGGERGERSERPSS